MATSTSAHGSSRLLAWQVNRWHRTERRPVRRPFKVSLSLGPVGCFVPSIAHHPAHTRSDDVVQPLRLVTYMATGLMYQSPVPSQA